MTPLEAAILSRVGSLPTVRLFRRHVGLSTVRGHVVRSGIKGQADLWGWLVPSGRHIEIECKAGSGRLSREQRAWRAVCERTGVLYVLATCVEDVEAAIST